MWGVRRGAAGHRRGVCAQDAAADAGHEARHVLEHLARARRALTSSTLSTTPQLPLERAQNPVITDSREVLRGVLCTPERRCGR
jgi:hypothetical protein